MKFGEVYFTWIKRNYLKGWKFHKKMHMNLTVPVGNVKCIFYDKTANKKIEFKLSEKNQELYMCRQKYGLHFKILTKKKI